MRKSVVIKNRIAIAMMIIGMLMVMGAGSSFEVSNNFAHIIKVGISGALLSVMGYKLWKF